ncbi:MAG: hypothetical protein EP308_02670 [Burkholderiales bacterium]|nr:MAG: hypothetical protein EP308_02670 [Burkholderiales bacterium]
MKPLEGLSRRVDQSITPIGKPEPSASPPGTAPGRCRSCGCGRRCRRARRRCRRPRHRSAAAVRAAATGRWLRAGRSSPAVWVRAVAVASWGWCPRLCHRRSRPAPGRCKAPAAPSPGASVVRHSRLQWRVMCRW